MRPPPIEAESSAAAKKSRKNARLLLVASAALALFICAAGIVYFSMRPATLRIAVGPNGSDDQRVVQAIAQALARERGNTRLRVVVTQSSSDSAKALDAGEADLAVVRGDTDLPKNAQAVAVLRKNLVVLWAPAPKPAANGKRAPRAVAITKVTDLSGKRIGIIGRSQSNVNLLHLILSQYGIQPERVMVTQFGVTEVSEAAQSDKVDVLLAVGPANSKITADAVAASSRAWGKPTFIDIDAADALAQRHAVYDSAEVPAGSFGGAPPMPAEAVKTISFAHHIVARKSLSESVVANFTRQLFQIRQSIVTEMPHAARIETPDTDKDAALAAHPGAAAYVDGEEKTWMERYGDYVWWALMFISVAGSVGAWTASYLRRDEKVANTHSRERLLDILAEARSAPDGAALDQLQAEADEILRLALHGFDTGFMDESSLKASDICLQHVHNAIADRRAVLGSQRSGRPAVALLQAEAAAAQLRGPA